MVGTGEQPVGDVTDAFTARASAARREGAAGQDHPGSYEVTAAADRPPGSENVS